MKIVSTTDITEENKLISTKDITEERIRPSDPGKQSIAGLTDIFTGIPSLIGVVGAGLEASADTLLDEGEQSFLNNFVKAQEEGVDKTFLEAGGAARNFVNESFGIAEPVSLEDWAARTAAMMIPIPGVKLAANAGKLAKGANLAANLTTNLVKPGANFGKRAVAQMGIGAGVDQGMRALTGAPLALSDEALFGTLVNPPPEENPHLPMRAGGLRPGEVQTPMLGGGSKDDEFNDSLVGQTIDTSLIEDVRTMDTFDINEEDAGATKLLQEMNTKIEEADNKRLMTNTAIAVSAAATIFFGTKYRTKLFKSNSQSALGLGQEEQVSGLSNALANIKKAPGVTATGQAAFNEAKKAGSRFYANVFDKTSHNEAHLRAVGVPEDEIKQITGQELVDVFGSVEQFLKDGKFGQASPTVVRSLKSIREEFFRLDDVGRQKFNDGVAAIQEDIARSRGTAFDALSKDVDNQLGDLNKAFESGTLDELELILKEQADLIESIRGTGQRTRPGLWTESTNASGKVKRTYIEDPQIAATIKEFNAVPQFRQMMKDIAKINSAVLDESVRRGAGDAAWAKAVKNQFSRDGQVLYIPGKSNVARAAWYKRLATSMGIHGSVGKTLRGVSNWHMKGLVEGEGIRTPLDPFNATADYALNVMEHTNTSVKQWNILTRLTGLQQDTNGIWRAVDPKLADGTARTRYLGSADMADPRNQGGQTFIVFNQDDKIINKNFDTKSKATFTPEQMANMDDVMWVQRGSTYHGFVVGDKQLKKALEFDAALHNRVLKFGNFWKRVMTRFTTGNLSPFAPISFMYNNSISTYNAFLAAEGGLKAASREAIKTWKDSYKGAWELFSTKVSEEYAGILTQSLKENTGLFKNHPQILENIATVVSRKAKDNLIAPIQRETGASASSQAASEFARDIPDILEQAVPYVSNTWGANALPRMWRIWNHLNTALHEGTAMGITMRKQQEAFLANPTASKSNLTRQARRDATNIIGDVRLRGSSDTAKAFHAVTPFSGAMMQAWATMGRSMSKAGLTKSLGTVVAGIGMPTLLEATYNSTLDTDARFQDPDDPTKQWSYRDYYWNGYTVDQRNNNVIIMIPGKPPWEAIIKPVIPELSLFRGASIDAFEAIFGASVNGIDTGNHLLAGAMRTFDIPPNPFIAAVANTFGIKLSANLLPEDPDGQGLSFLQGRPLFTGSRVTGSARAKFEGSEIDKDVVAIFQSIFGSAGTLMIATYEGFNSGNEKASLGKRMEFAMDALGRNIKRQVRYVQPLLDKTLRPSMDPHIQRDLLNKKAALQQAAKGWETTSTGGLFKNQKAVRGDVLSPTQDPIAMMMQAGANDVLASVSIFDSYIQDLQHQKNTIGTGMHDLYKGQALTVKDRDEIIDSLTLRIEALKSQQLSVYKTQEDLFKENVKNQIGVDIPDFQFDTFTPNQR